MKQHFPGMVRFAGDRVLAVSIEHYENAPDRVDPDHQIFANKLERVLGEFFVSL